MTKHDGTGCRSLRPRSLGPLSRRRAIALLGGSALAAAAGSAGHAQGFPDHAVRIVVPFPPGGGNDIIARVFAESMGKEFRQSVWVDNKPGGATIIGTSAVADSPPDGHTLGIFGFPVAVNPSLYPKLPYDHKNAFAPVVMVGRSPNVLVVPANSPFQDVGQLLAKARAEPGMLTYGSFGNGSSSHLAGELLCHLAKVKMTHVPYKGSSPAVIDLIGGRIDLMFATSVSMSQPVGSGQLRALAVTSRERSAAYPEAPTMIEAGVPDYLLESWYGLFTRAGTPAPALARLNAAANRAMATSAFQRIVISEGLTVVGGPPETLGDYLRNEQARWGEVIKAANIRAE